MLKLRRQLKLDVLSSVDQLDEEKRLSHHYRDERIRYRWIQDRLPEFPYWGWGHLECARLAVLFQEHELAYSSLLAVLLLKPGVGVENEARYLLGVVYTARGRFSEALSVLEQVQDGIAVSEEQLLEARAAALLALDRHEEAAACLERLPSHKRSGPMEAVLSYTRGSWKEE